MTMSTRSFESCPQCSVDVHVARRFCVFGCNLKRRGRPKGTTRLKEYGVGTNGGRPVGTTAEKGLVSCPHLFRKNREGVWQQCHTTVCPARSVQYAPIRLQSSVTSR